MPVLLSQVAVGLAGTQLLAGISGNKRAKKRAAEEALVQTIGLQRQAADAEGDLFVQAEAQQQQRELIADRLELERKQQDEAARQAGTPGVEFTLGADPQSEARKRRGQFFNYAGGA